MIIIPILVKDEDNFIEEFSISPEEITTYTAVRK